MLIRDVGQQDALQGRFKNRDRSLANPAQAILTIVRPSGVEIVEAGVPAAPGNLTIVSTGVWEYIWTWDEDGDWVWRWAGTGSVTTSGHTTVRVRPSL